MFKRGFLLVLWTSGMVWAQIADGVITGRVYDERGFLLGNVKITVRNLDTGRTWSVLTNEKGRYLASRLPPGDYRVETSLAEFATAIQEASLGVQNEARLDFVLRGGENAEASTYRERERSARSRVAAASRQTGPFAVQLASYRTRLRAEGLRAMLEDVGFDAYVVESNVPQSGRYYRVRVGPFDTREEANERAVNMQDRLSDLLPDYWIVPDR